jgi:hypothetical protein
MLPPSLAGSKCPLASLRTSSSDAPGRLATTRPEEERKRREQNRIGDETDAWEHKQTNGRRQLGEKHTEGQRVRETRALQGAFDECSEVASAGELQRS